MKPEPEARVNFQSVDNAGDLPRTAGGTIAAATSEMQRMQTELITLQEKLASFDGSMPTLQLDPQAVRETRWANRHASAYGAIAFANLKASIADSGGNVLPILVRCATEGTYEVVFGHRRRRACLELGLPVLAVVSTLAMSDTDVFLTMDRENRERADLSPFEQGTSYIAAISSGLFPSRRRLAEALGVSHTWVAKAMAVAELPGAIIECFRSPLEIQPRHAKQIADAMQADQAAVLRVAERLRTELPGLEPNKVVSLLLRRTVLDAVGNELRIDGASIGAFRMGRRGRLHVVLDMSAASLHSLDAIGDAMKAVLRDVGPKRAA